MNAENAQGQFIQTTISRKLNLSSLDLTQNSLNSVESEDTKSQNKKSLFKQGSHQNTPSKISAQPQQSNTKQVKYQTQRSSPRKKDENLNVFFEEKFSQIQSQFRNSFITKDEFTKHVQEREKADLTISKTIDLFYIAVQAEKQSQSQLKVQIETLTTRLAKIQDEQEQASKKDQHLQSQTGQLRETLNNKIDYLSLRIEELQAQHLDSNNSSKCLKDQIQKDNEAVQKYLDTIADRFRLFKSGLEKSIEMTNQRNFSFQNEWQKRFNIALEKSELQVTKMAEFNAEILNNKTEISNFKAELKKKMPMSELDNIMNKVKQMPTLETFTKSRIEITMKMSQFEKKVEKMYLETEKSLQIIARYDQVICEKAQKHSLLELEQKFDTKLSQLEVAVKDAQMIGQIAYNQFEKATQSSNNCIELVNKIQCKKHQEQMKQLVDKQNELFKLVQKVNFEMETKVAKMEVQSKHTSIDERINSLLTATNTVMVLLNESLSVQYPRADDTNNQKTNRLTHLIQQVNLLINQVSTDKASQSKSTSNSNRISKRRRSVLDILKTEQNNPSCDKLQKVPLDVPLIRLPDGQFPLKSARRVRLKNDGSQMQMQISSNFSSSQGNLLLAQTDRSGSLNQFQTARALATDRTDSQKKIDSPSDSVGAPYIIGRKSKQNRQYQSVKNTIL